MADLLTWADAWQALIYEHAPFQPSQTGVQDLLREFGDLERLFLSTPELKAYYDECMRSIAAGDASINSAAAARPADASVVSLADGKTRHVAAMQLQLMEDSFYTLRLDRYANAPDNSGWVNLFRRWANSPTFQRHARDLKSTFSREFLYFYSHYIEAWPEDVPVPHPWDMTDEDNDGRAYFGGRTQVGIELSRARAAKGIYLDPGRREAGHPRGVHEPPPSRMGVRDKTPSREKMPPAPPEAGVADSSDSTD